MPRAAWSAQLSRPARAVARTYAAVPLKDGTDGGGGRERRRSGSAFDATDLERSRPASLDADAADTALADGEADDWDDLGDLRDVGDGAGDDGSGAVEVVQSVWRPRRNAARLAAVALNTLNDGLNDSAAGALLPYIERHYGIGYGVVSLIFVASAFGAILAATVVDPARRRWGTARTLCLGQLLMGAGYVPLLTMAAPFPAVVAGFFAVGLGEAANNAIGNAFCAGLQQATGALGIMHGSYGLGGISGPLVATAVAVASSAASSAVDDRPAAAVFGRYYLLPFGLCLLSAAMAAWSFAGYERDWGETVEPPSPPPPSLSPGRAAERRRRWRLGLERHEAATAARRLQLQLQQQPSWDGKSQNMPLPPWPSTTPDADTTAHAGPSGTPPSPFPSPPASTPPTPPPAFASTATASGVGSRATSVSDSPDIPHIPDIPDITGISGMPGRPTMPVTPEEPAELLDQQDRDDAAEPAPPDYASATAHDVRDSHGTRDRHEHRHEHRHGCCGGVARRRRRAADRLHGMFTGPATRVVLLGALFLFMYQGSEVSIAGWVTSFLMTDRGGTEPGVGYMTAGFWVGITAGRFGLSVPLQRLVGARRAVYGCVVGAAVFELLVWRVPNVVGDAVAVAVVGLLLGPVYPCAAGLLMRSLSRRQRVAAVGVMSAFGSAGGAAAPFVTGVLAQAVGTFVLHPVVLVLFAGMLGFWFLVPTPRKPTE